jgi:LacI family transcriptional regulator
MHPGISTVHQPAEEMGQRGVELLLDIIEDRPKRVTKVVLKPEVVLRETTERY